MNTLIFRTTAPYLTALMLLFSVFVLLRGHNEPGGGFIGGLIAASAVAIYGMASGVAAVRRALVFRPLSIAGAGLFIATLAGLLSLVFGAPFLTGLWVYPSLFGVEVPLSSVLLFDIGVYLVVFGTFTAILLALEERGGGLMEPVFAILVGLFFAAAIYLMLSSSSIRILLGVALLGNAVNLLIFIAGRLTREIPPIIPAGARRLAGRHRQSAAAGADPDGDRHRSRSSPSCWC